MTTAAPSKKRQILSQAEVAEKTAKYEANEKEDRKLRLEAALTRLKSKLEEIKNMTVDDLLEKFEGIEQIVENEGWHGLVEIYEYDMDYLFTLLFSIRLKLFSSEEETEEKEEEEIDDD